MAVPWGNLQLDELLSMPDYDFHRVALLIDELQDAIDAVLSDEPDKKYDISWRVIEDDRPFHPQRLWDTCHRFMGAGVYRSKGFSGYREGMTWHYCGTRQQGASISNS